MSTTVLVTGSTGKVGRRLIPLLARRGMTVRTASRSPLPERAGIEPVRFDWTEESTYETAREGVSAMYLVAGPIPRPEHASDIATLLDGATGVERVVLMSTYGVDQAPPDNPLRRIELLSNRLVCRTPSCDRQRSCRTSRKGSGGMSRWPRPSANGTRSWRRAATEP